MARIYTPSTGHYNMVRHQARHLCWECSNIGTIVVNAEALKLRGHETEYYCSEAHQEKGRVRREQAKQKKHPKGCQTVAAFNYARSP